MSQACKPWAGRLTAWFDGETNKALSSETREHLLGCAPCRSALAVWRGLREDLEVLQPASATPEILQGIGAGLSDGREAAMLRSSTYNDDIDSEV